MYVPIQSIMRKISPTGTLPSTKGPYKTATDILQWNDVQIKIWYPTDATIHQRAMNNADKVYKNAEHTEVDYFGHMARVYKMPYYLIDYYFTLGTNSITRRDYSARIAPLNGSIDRFPVIIFSHGLYGMGEHYTVIAENMASYGYIFIAPYHTDSSCPAVIRKIRASREKLGGNSAIEKMILFDERREPFMAEQKDLIQDHSDENIKELMYREYQLKIRLENIRTILNALNTLASKENTNSEKDSIEGYETFAGRIDLERVACLGHSFGGGTCCAACVSIMEPIAFKCGLSLDGWMDPIVNDLERKNDDPSILEQIKQIRSRKSMEGGKSLPPFAFINSDLWQWDNNLKSMDKILLTMQDTEELNPETAQPKVYKMKMKDTHHHNFDDVAILMPRFARFMNYIGKVDPQKHCDELIELLVRYFDYHLQFKREGNESWLASDPLQPYLFNKSRVGQELPNRPPPMVLKQHNVTTSKKNWK